MNIKTLILFSIFIEFSVYGYTLGGSDSNLQGWDTDELVFKVNTANCPVTDAELYTAIDDALSLWNGVTTSHLKVLRGGSSSTTPAQLAGGTATDDPVIACDTSFSTTTGASAASVAGVGGYSATSDGINYGYLLLNAESSTQANIGNASAVSLSVIIAHEIGHVLGLGHSSDSKALMYFNASAKANLALSQDDINGLTYLYPRKEIGGAKVFGCGAVIPPVGGGSGKGGPQDPMGFLELIFLVCLAAFVERITRSKAVTHSTN